MTKEIVTFENEGGILAVHGERIQAVVAAVKEAAGAGGMSMSDLEKISIPAGGAISWAVNTMTGEETRKEIFAAIVGDTETRSYWSAEFDGGNLPPDCSSQDAVTGHGSPGGDCASCPYSQWESAAKGSGQACNHRRVLLLLTPDSAMPVMLSVPPSSLKTVRKDFIRVAGIGVAPKSALWSFTLTSEKNAGGIKYSAVTAKFVRPLTEEELTLCRGFTSAVSKITVDASVVDASL